MADNEFLTLQDIFSEESMRIAAAQNDNGDIGCAETHCSEPAVQKRRCLTNRLCRSDELLELCALGAADDIRKALDDGKDPNTSDEYKGTALMYAANRNSDDAIKLLLDAGADVNARDDFSNTPLICASWKNTCASIKILLDAGADPNAANEGGNTALFWAAGRGDAEMIRLLTDAGADPNAQDEDEISPIFWAMGGGYIHRLEAMKALLDAGADINARDEDGDTLLIDAIRSNKDDVIKFLIEAGADVNAEGEYDTPLTMAIHNAVERSTIKKDPLSPVRVEDILASIKLLLDAGADMNAVSHLYGVCSAAEMAAAEGCPDVIEVFRAAGADI